VLTLPQPGGPYNKIDAGIDRIPFKTDCAMSDGNPSGKISSSILSFTEAWPMISLNRIESVVYFRRLFDCRNRFSEWCSDILLVDRYEVAGVSFSFSVLRF
jgi:hypothetical protein